jgi:heat shock protein HslJ
MMPKLPTLTAAILFTGVFAGACSGPTSPSAAPLSADQLTGPWTLVAQQRPGEPETPPPPGATFRIEVADGRAAVTADCNHCGGVGAIGDSTVTIGPNLACTRAYCASAPADGVFLRILAGESRATLDGGEQLTLRSDRGVLRFRR